MSWSVVFWIGAAIGVIVAFLVAQMIYLFAVMSWGDQRTNELAYYGLPPLERAKFKKTLRRHARVLFPILRIIGRSTTFAFPKVSFRHGDISGPQGMCTADSFTRGEAYAPQSSDIFVATQMKCGTTWMQHVVYQVLRRGNGDLVEKGSTMYAVSPWLESVKTVPVDQAPLLGGERPSRIIKTHFPAAHCPYSTEARYVYVARHPVSCFASCVDFIATNLGTFGPTLAQLEEWFCSDELMWWGTWTKHVNGWWERAQQEGNVLFVHFEDMKRDLPAIVERVRAFLGLEPLAAAEIEAVVTKCGFAYMQEHKDAFEMFPPHILATDAQLFVRGTADRHRDVPAETRERIAAWAAAGLDGMSYPLARFYPDVASQGEHAPRP
jgi:Sulfotransferase domain